MTKKERSYLGVEEKIRGDIKPLLKHADSLLLTSVVKEIELRNKVYIEIKFDSGLKEYQSLLRSRVQKGQLIYTVLLPKKLKITTNEQKKYFLRYLLGHELGHIFLHLNDENYSSFEESSTHTLEANFFAFEILKKRGYPKNRTKLPDEFENPARRMLLSGEIHQERFHEFYKVYCENGHIED